MATANRRQFLYCLTGAGSAVGLGAVTSLLADENGKEQTSPSLEVRDAGPYKVVTKRSRALGSNVSITAIDPDASKAESAVVSAFDELRRTDELMSIYRPESQLSHLNRHGGLDGPHPYLVEILGQARIMARRSDGAFDVTVQPLWRLYDAARQRGELPVPDAIDAARALVDWRRVECSASRIRLSRRGAAITLNGIAQGFAADKAVTALREHGVKHGLVNTGEIGTLGRRPSGDAWTVGIQHPRHEDAYVSLTKLAGRCLATSGDYATHFTPDFRHHHLFDPRTGRSPTELSSVSVAAATATEADALSTAVFVLGPERGLKVVRSTPGADVLLILKEGRMLATEGFPITT